MTMSPSAFLQTHTSKQQHDLELKVAELYGDLAEYVDEEDREEMLLLLRDRHTRYLQGGLGQLPGGFVSLDASRPWICYWVLHGLALLQAPLPKDISASEVVAFLSSCQHPDGGYGGGPGQLAHLAPTYAAVSALLTLGGQEALGSINREGVWQFLNRMAIPPQQGGGFRMHDGGESDVRSCYTAMAVATGLCLDVQALAAKAGMVDYIRRCQTYEGGIGGEPGNEAHGGYTYCGLAALCLAHCPQALDLPGLAHWAAQRQGAVEGGFNGRTNKLVDGCYSFWQGGVFPLLQRLLQQQQDGTLQEQVPPQLNSSCVSQAYPAVTAPAHWQQQHQQQQQQQRLVVPDLPDLSQVQGPVEQAEADAQRLNAAFEALAEAALASNDSASTDLDTTTAAGAAGAEVAAEGAAGDGTRPSESRQELLLRAEAAEQAAEYADAVAQIAALSAAVLFPCSRTPASAFLPAGVGAAAAGGLGSPPAAAAAAAGASADEAEAVADATAPPNPLFNTRALQLWILRGCQQLKGGLRDKPGKSPDYYHTCYCLSGLTAAQHMEGGCVVGPDTLHSVDVQGGSSSSSSSSSSRRGAGSSNELAAADPLLNVLVGKVEEAKLFFESAGKVV